ncbi:MAG: sugar transferase [Spirochaetaceae bacterium]|nr:MAG: sugar transferase [Spirochaetaceae bacterium]
MIKPTGTRPRSRLSWKPAFSPPAADSPPGIYGQREFAQLVQYERQRADRLDAPLSLVLFRIHPSPSGSSDTSNRSASLTAVLTGRVRATDAIGRFDGERIAVLLPSTDLHGAEIFAEAVSAKLAAARIPFCGPAEVMSHPALKLPPEAAPSQPEHNDGCAEGVVHTDSLEQVALRPIPRWKRALDLFGAGSGLLLLSPLFALVALYIKIVSPGPVFFSQPRVGRGGREFPFIKFRSMHVNTDESMHNRHAAEFIRANGSMQKLDEADPRIYFGGRLLRVSCIDELPQLWNVLRGEMSLVGPRPCIPYEASEYQRWHRHRFSMLPGMSGLWQVSGKNKLTFAEMIRLDIRYEKKMSLGLDLLIILRTIPAIVVMLGESAGRRLSRLRARPPAREEPPDES